MALATFPDGYWLNSDGLLVKFGRTEGLPGSVGEYGVAVASEAVVNVDISFSHFTGKTAGQAVVLDYDARLPAGAIISKIEFITQVAFATNPTSIDVGLVRSDMTTTYDEDGLIDGLLLAELDSVDESTLITSETSTYPGALWVAASAAALPYDGYIVGSFAGTAPTVGRVLMNIYYSIASTKPNGPSGV